MTNNIDIEIVDIIIVFLTQQCILTWLVRKRIRLQNKGNRLTQIDQLCICILTG